MPDILCFRKESKFFIRQAARLAHEIRLGAKPAELPLDSTAVMLTVNLQTAEKIGINIPDDILLQADNIIR